jgi:O-antigen biosynthesis protein WbqV
MKSPTEFSPGQQKTESITAHVIWMTTGLSCDGDSVAATSATHPSLEDLVRGIIPGMPKAAPTCVMGATKRLAELYLTGFGLEHDAPMQVKSVRFGNVLGSQGSVQPRFAAQIEAGGPLEVTHPDMERFFMSADEAVGLILGVTALEAEQGSYFMEMGEAVSILDLGRQMIARAGANIDIEITGLRPGEKLSEQLTDEYEDVSATSLPNVFRVKPKAVDCFVTSADIAHLESVARTMENPIVRQRVFANLDQRLRREERFAG